MCVFGSKDGFTIRIEPQPGFDLDPILIPLMSSIRLPGVELAPDPDQDRGLVPNSD